MGFFSGIGDLLSGGVGSLVGGVVKGVLGASSTNSASSMNRKMSDTAHQREVKDLYAAGLNPILSAGGGGASTPSAPVASFDDVMTPAISTAQAIKKNKAEVDNLMETNKAIQAGTANTQKDTALKNSAIALNSAAEATQRTQALTNMLQGRLLAANTHNVNLDSQKKAVEAAVYTSALSPVKSATDAVGSIAKPYFEAIKNNVHDVLNYNYSQHFKKVK